MSFNKKYAGLPDLDPAPDIYETPDLTDEASTIPTTTIRTTSDADDHASNPDIDRHGVDVDEARAHFLGATVDARNVNFSDSIALRRKAYGSKSRRRRGREDGLEEAGDYSDSDEETFERKLARLRREVEELKDEMESRKETGAEPQETPPEVVDDGVLELSRALDHLHASSRNVPDSHSAATMLSQKLTADGPRDLSSEQNALDSVAAKEDTTAVSVSSPGVLAHAAAFDGRLALVEGAIGISSSSNPFVSDGISEPVLQPVLPALDHLTSRLATLTNVLVGPTPASAVPPTGSGAPSATFTTTHLEALASRVRRLTSDTEALASARKRAVDAAKAAQNARLASTTAEPTSDMSVSSSSGTDIDQAATQRDEQATKIQALYATLPTIQSLHPILPSVLERLRSLRAIHAGAAHAAESLNELEKRHAAMAGEIDQWREGLLVVEEKMARSETAMKSNIDLVEPWVRDLEKRLDQLESGAA